uniref:Protein MNN4-like n=1 Tax=Caenorhabditis tropicalis TaxID=1561998 RepID=A0A1I7V3G7_9PELO
MNAQSAQSSIPAGCSFNFEINSMDTDGYWHTENYQYYLEAYQAIAVMSLHHHVKMINGELEKERKEHQETKRKLAQRDSLIFEIKTKTGEEIDEKKDEKIYKLKKEMKKSSKKMKKAVEEMEIAKEEKEFAVEEKEKLEKSVDEHKKIIRNMLKEKFEKAAKPEKKEEMEEIFMAEGPSEYVDPKGEYEEVYPVWSDGTDTGNDIETAVQTPLIVYYHEEPIIETVIEPIMQPMMEPIMEYPLCDDPFYTLQPSPLETNEYYMMPYDWNNEIPHFESYQEVPIDYYSDPDELGQFY